MIKDNIWLVVLTILKNIIANGKDYPIYEMENKSHVWNHQPDIYI